MQQTRGDVSGTTPSTRGLIGFFDISPRLRLKIDFGSLKCRIEITMLVEIKSLKNNQIFLKYLKNTSWLFGERLIKIGIGFVVIMLMTRYLGPENYGLLSYSQSFVAMLVAFSTLGLEVILAREMSKNKDKVDVILGTALTMKFIASLLALCFIICINYVIEDKQAALLTNIIAFTLIFKSLNLGIDTYFQSQVISRFSAIANTFAYILSTVIKLSLIYFQAELEYFAYILVFDVAIIFIGYLYIYTLQNKSILALRYDRKLAVYFLKTGWPMMMVAMAVFFYTKIDQIMIKHLLDNESVGYYAAALRVSELFYFIPLLITQSVFPKIVQEREAGNAEVYFRLLLNVYKIVIWISIPIVILVTIFSDLIVTVLFGNSFSESANILSILAFCLIFVSVGSVNTKILYLENYEKKYLKRSIFGVFINIGLNFILLPIYGAIGAAVSTLVTLFMIHYIYDLFDSDLWVFYHLKFKCFVPTFK